MRFRILLTVVSGAALFSPLVAYAGVPFFGPIIPTAYNVCPASWGLLVTVINNIISLLLTLTLTFVAPLMIAYAGFLFVITPYDASGHSKAKAMLQHVIVGLVIAFAAWLIVDAIMAALYHPSANTSWGTRWADIIRGNANDTCLSQKGALPGDKFNQASSTAITVGTTGIGGGNTLNPAAGPAGSACDPTVVQTLAAAGNPSYSLTATQANTLACIAKPESNCGAPHNPPNYKWGQGSSAAGAFQVLLSTNAQCYENTSCYAAAGVSGPLNCATGFTGGNPKTDPVGAAVVDRCVRAANNLGCSVSAASCLLAQNNGNFSPWQADVNNAKQTGCINTGG